MTISANRASPALGRAMPPVGSQTPGSAARPTRVPGVAQRAITPEPHRHGLARRDSYPTCLRDRIRTPMGELRRLSAERSTLLPRVSASDPVLGKIIL